MRIPLTFVLLIGFCPLGQAQSPDFAFERVRLPGGSTQNFVTGIAQDRQGFLWLATHGGLIRYDGYESVVYMHDPLDSLSISSDWVENVYVDRDGTLWAGTFGDGLDRFDPRTETFTHFRHDPTDPTSLSGDTVTVMLEDRNGALWVGTHQGLNRMDRRTGTFTRFRHDPGDPGSLSDDEVRVLYEDRAGTLWVGTGDAFGSSGQGQLERGGLNRFEPGTGAFIRFQHDPLEERTLIDNDVQALFEDSRGTFWVATSGDGLHSMDREEGTFTRHRYDPHNQDQIWGLRKAIAPQSAGITFIYEDGDGALWIGGFEGGITRFDPATGGLSEYANTPGDPSSLGNNVVWRMYESRDGVLWVLTWGGLFKVVDSRSPFRHYTLDGSGISLYSSVEALHLDQDGTLWAGTQSGGLSRMHWSGAKPPAASEAVRYLHDPDDPQSLSDNSVSFVFEDREGTLWVGTNSGLDRMDRRTGRFTRYQHHTNDPQSLGPGPVVFICEDHEGVLWLATFGGGLNRFDRETQTFTRHVHDPANPSSLSSDEVQYVHPARDGYLWIGTWRGGLNRLDPTTGDVRRYPFNAPDRSGLSDRTVTSIYEDDEGALWIGTLAAGLNRLDRNTGHFSHFTTANSELPDDQISAIIGDERGNLWITTGTGLISFGVTGGTLDTYDLALRVQVWRNPAPVKSPKGEFLFGGANGFVVFNPEDVLRNDHQNRRPPQVVLTGLSLSNRPVTPGPDGPLKDPPWNSRQIRLAHDENTFSLDFVGVHFENPAENRYAYMLEGYEDAWREVGSTRQARYYKVPPGRYVFRAKAANAGGVWSEEGASISVVVLPPWWRTWWAYAFYVLLAAAGIFAADRFQRRRVIRKEREAHARVLEDMNERLRAHERQLEDQNALLERQKGVVEEQARRLAELDEMKSRFFANISHEFRTPLTLMLGPLKDAMKGGRPLDSAQAAMMQRNAERLLRLINQLLDLSKLDAGGMHLHMERGDLVAFVRSITLSFASRAERDGITLSYNAEPGQVVTGFDRDKLEKVAYNLLSNAFKFTPTGGKIGVVVSADEETVAVSVRDTGPGIPRQEIPRLFDRFHQVNSPFSSRHGGTGIGLALVKELVELHGGTISVESQVGFGTTFVVELPVMDAIGGEETELEMARVSGTEESEEGEGEIEHGSHLEGSAPRILVVEDNADVRAYLRSHLDHDYAVFEARDGVEGLERARELKPHLIISDVMMPRMDGFSLTREIRADESIHHIPVVLLTARADVQSRIEGFEEGADDYLPKPFDAEELLARVESLIEIRRLLRRQFSGEVTLGPSEIAVPSADAAFLEQVREVVEREMENATFGVDQLADEVALGARQLQRRIKQLTTLSGAGYIRMMRLERAALLLEQHAGLVSEIAYRVGYRDVDHFSKVFKQVFGVPPSGYSDHPIPRRPVSPLEAHRPPKTAG